MEYNILTSFNKHYWDEVANQTSKKLDENWYDKGKIFLYHELDDNFLSIIKKPYSKRVEWINLYNTVTELPAWIEKFKDEPKANGFNPKGGINWRTHAIKWAHKTFPLLYHARKQKQGWLFWIDTDAECFKKVDDKFIKSICDERKIVSYLGRKTNYSECGFLGFNLNHPETKNFIEMWWNIYPTGDFINISETHDSWIFDEMRRRFGKPELFDDLNASSTTDKNPFGFSKIGSHFLHVKGRNKKQHLAKAKRRI